MGKQGGLKQMVWKLSDLVKLLKIGVITCISITLLHCGGAKDASKKDLQQVNQSVRYDESFDPLTLNDDDLEITADSIRPTSDMTETTTDTTVQSLVVKEAEGFRVQILASNNIETASLTEQEAMARFASLGVKIYLIFEAPLYKIRVGDCVDRNAAEDLRDKAKEIGYGTAFIVKTKINLNN
jgi:SPOR domain